MRSWRSAWIKGPRVYTLSAQIEDFRGILHQIEAEFRVTVGPFIVTEATMPYARAELLDVDLEQAEAETLAQLISHPQRTGLGPTAAADRSCPRFPLRRVPPLRRRAPHAPYRLGFPRHPGDAGRLDGCRARRL